MTQSARTIQICITVVAFILILLHAFFPNRIDEITVMLFVIIVLTWTAPFLKSIELPGGLKITLPTQELEKAGEKVKESGLISPKTDLKSIQKHRYAFQTVAGDDLNLALSGLRIEIEARLNELAEDKGLKVHRPGAGSLTGLLEKSNVLSHDEAAAIRDLLPLLNQAAHGAKVEESSFDWAMDFGPKLLGALEDRLGESKIPNLIENWKRRDGVIGLAIGMQLSKFFINSPEAFVSAMSEHLDEFQDWLIGLENHTFTMFESDSELEDELYLAYYDKMKQLMLDAAKSLKQTQYSELASKIEDAVNNIEIRKIW